MVAPASSSLHCRRCHTALDADDLRCVLCGLATPEPSHGRLSAQPRAEILRCSSCGAAVRYSVEHRAPSCAFCRQVMTVERPRDPVQHAELLAPFVVGEEDAKRAVHGWLGRGGFFRPSDLASRSSLRSLEPLWWACWLVNADALVSWTADTEVGRRRSAWAPHSGQTTMRFEGLMVHGSRGLRSDETAKLGVYDVRALDSSPRGPARAAVECFGLRSAARRNVGVALSSAAAWRVDKECIPGQRRRNVHVAELVKALEVRRVGLPAYVLAYEYRGRRFRAIVHGQDSRRVIGARPIAWWKIILLVAAIVGLLAGVLIAEWWPKGGKLWLGDLFGVEPSCQGERDCFRLAERYRRGDGVGASDRRAAKYYRKACDGGYASGCLELADLYVRGRGVKPSDDRAYAYYRLACAKGSREGCAKLEQICWSASAHKALACFELGEAKRTAEPPDDIDAVEALRAACGAGMSAGCTRVEQMCKAGSVAACFDVALRLHGGTHGEADKQRAWDLWSKLCAKDHGASCYHLGEMARDGVRGTPDPTGAVELFGKACRLGNPSGCNRQRQMCRAQRVAGCP